MAEPNAVSVRPVGAIAVAQLHADRLKCFFASGRTGDRVATLA